MQDITKAIQLGTVISGTLRPQDLLPAFANTLMQFDPSSSTLGEAHGYVDSDTLDDVLPDLIGALLDEINSYCPATIYFGAHPGDGADFGFWLAEDA